MLSTTLGQLLVNDALPEDLRDWNMVLDKAGLREKLRQVAEKYPERYQEISQRWATIGRRVSQEQGGYSFGLQHLRKAVAAVKTRQKILAKLQQVIDNDDDDETRQKKIVQLVGREIKPQQEAIYEEALVNNNPLARQILSGSRGNKMNLTSLLGSDMLYVDHRNRPIPIPILRSYSEGLSPEEYMAGAYGARKGVTDLKFATQDAGFLGKQLNQVAHRLVVTGLDYDDPNQQQLLRGVPVETDEIDNDGALLAVTTGPYPKNTLLTPKVLKHLKRLGKDRILIRSPMVGGSPEGGVYARDVGVRERGILPGRGEAVGQVAAQAISEPISQTQISSKHTGGVAGEGKGISGFDYINQLVQIPKTFKGGAAHARLDGTVQRIEPAPAGGTNVTIDNERHYVGQGYELKVKKGDTVEAGDVISEGLPNPAEIVRFKGVGEGRRYFTKAFWDAMRDAGMSGNRRNIELLSRGLINHVRLTDEYRSHVPGDVIHYSTLEHQYEPREDHQTLDLRAAVGTYLESPVLHYTIGTQVRPSMLKDLQYFGVKELKVHDKPPPFEPEMIRGMYSLQHDPDWMTRMYGSGLKKGLLDAVHRGGVSDELGTSFVPSLARAVDFGQQPEAQVKPPEPGYTPEIGVEKEDAAVPPLRAFNPKPSETSNTWFGGRFNLGSFKKAATDHSR